MKYLLSIALLVVAARSAEPFRAPQTTAARKTNAVICLISWNAVPPQFQVTQYSVYQSENVTGPYELISTTDTNEITLVVEPGTCFWNIRALSVWHGTNLTSEPSVSVGMIESKPGGVSVNPVKPQRKTESIPDALLIPVGSTMPVPTNAPINRLRTIPSRRPASFNNPSNLPTQ